jgi:hypothetical protein
LEKADIILNRTKEDKGTTQWFQHIRLRLKPKQKRKDFADSLLIDNRELFKTM